MRRLTLGWVLSVAVLVPNMGTAQVVFRPDSYPATTAANAEWQRRGDPVFHAGELYYPTGPTVFFDGNVMARIGTYEGVPLYEDGGLSPSTIVYVPIGGNLVRPYERLRVGELAGTVGSRLPSFPMRREGEAGAPWITGGFSSTVDGFVPVIPEAPRPLSAAGIADTPASPGPTAASSVTSARVDRRTAPVVLQVWVSYDGARWFSAGSAVPYTADRFVQVGEHRGFPVYRERNGRQDQIYIASVDRGPVAPYEKNR